MGSSKEPKEGVGGKKNEGIVWLGHTGRKVIGWRAFDAGQSCSLIYVVLKLPQLHMLKSQPLITQNVTLLKIGIEDVIS